MKNIRSQAGFTLVEIAICLVVIGLLIGGVLKGAELIHRAKINNTAVQMKEYRSAYRAFRDKYKAVPGDMASADSQLANCNAATFCENGDGNNAVGGLAHAFWSRDQLGGTLPARETTQFWKHLSVSEMITGIEARANPANPAWGQTHPAAKLGGGFTVLFLQPNTTATGPAINVGFDGNALRLQGELNGSVLGGQTLTNDEALEIDRKFDDGRSQSGSIHGEGACDVEYDALRQGTCILFYLLDKR